MSARLAFGLATGGVAAWAMSQAAPFLMRKAAGRVLVWVWKADAELVVVMAQIQQATSDLPAPRAMMPMENDDTETFVGVVKGVGHSTVSDICEVARTWTFPAA